MTFSIRNIRFKNTALIDYVCTILLAFLISAYTPYPVSLVTIVLFVLSIQLHFAFEIKTETNDYLLKMLHTCF